MSEKEKPKAQPEPPKVKEHTLPLKGIPEITRELHDVLGGFGGSGRPIARPPDKPKKLDWKESFEINPENSQVNVEMNTQRWAEFFSEKRSAPADQFVFEVFDCKLVQVEVDGSTISLETHGQSNRTNAISFTCKLGNYYSLPFNNLQDFMVRFEQLANQHLEKVNPDYLLKRSVEFFEIVLPFNQDWTVAQLAQEYEKMRKSLAVSIEVFLKMLKQEERKSLKIPNPRVREGRGVGQKSASDATYQNIEAKEKVRGLEVTDVNLSLADMGGNSKLKEQIERLVGQYQHPDFFEKRSVKLPKGILLYGPPGTGKTLAAKIFAGEIKRKFYHVKASDILSKYYGESEQAVRDIFEHVEGPCIIFIDEIDSIGEHRDYASEPTRRVLSELLQQLDGLTSRSDIILLAATNRKESLDPALLRPGRFDRHLLVDKPDEDARKQIWNIHIEKQRKNSEVQIFAPDLNIDLLAEMNDGLVGADIEEIVRRTKEKAVFDSFQQEKDVLITTEILLEEVQSYRVERDKEKMQKLRRMGFHAPHERES